AETVLRDAHRLVRTGDGVASRMACALARSALRRGDAGEAKRWTRDALAGPLASEESLAEASSLLADDWARAGDETLTESTLTGALLMLNQTAGDHDEHTLALLERLAVLRLRLGRSGAAALLERALVASEALNGVDAATTSNVAGWLALARELEAWRAWRAAEPSSSAAAWNVLAAAMGERWQWMQPSCEWIAQAFAEARALAAPERPRL
ncbi:MAG: hypothetical protein WCF18_19035, partial [Chthoniobacteraceae bacterium]